MKEGIHPDYKQTTITCACGEVIETGSTKENIQVEICSKCHHSSQVSKSLSIQAVELKSSTDVSTEQQSKTNFLATIIFITVYKLNPYLRKPNHQRYLRLGR